jgi:hypothetical protein
MATLALVLMIAALVLFLIDAFANTGWRVNLQSLGLACFVGALLLGGATIGS